MSYKDDEFDPEAEGDVDFDGAANLPEDFPDEEESIADSLLSDDEEEEEE